MKSKLKSWMLCQMNTRLWKKDHGDSLLENEHIKTCRENFWNCFYLLNVKEKKKKYRTNKAWDAVLFGVTVRWNKLNERRLLVAGAAADACASHKSKTIKMCKKQTFAPNEKVDRTNTRYDLYLSAVSSVLVLSLSFFISLAAWFLCRWFFLYWKFMLLFFLLSLSLS